MRCVNDSERGRSGERIVPIYSADGVLGITLKNGGTAILPRGERSPTECWTSSKSEAQRCNFLKPSNIFDRSLTSTDHQNRLSVLRSLNHRATSMTFFKSSSIFNQACLRQRITRIRQ